MKMNKEHGFKTDYTNVNEFLTGYLKVKDNISALMFYEKALKDSAQFNRRSYILIFEAAYKIKDQTETFVEFNELLVEPRKIFKYMLLNKSLLLDEKIFQVAIKFLLKWEDFIMAMVALRYGLIWYTN